VNVVQKFIRSGHQETVDKCLRYVSVTVPVCVCVCVCVCVNLLYAHIYRWIDEDGTARAGESFCDAGCGVVRATAELKHVFES
jgi:hypothetical protein